MPAPQLRLPDAPELPGVHLFDDETMQALTDEERKFALYTGARCPEHKRNDIIALAGRGWRVDEIRRFVHVHRETVLNVMNEFAVEIQDYERRMAAKEKRCKWAVLDRIERELDQIPRQALGLTFKIISDTEANDSGRAIARVDHIHHIDLFSDFSTFVQELEARPVLDEKNGAVITLPAHLADADAGESGINQDGQQISSSPGGRTHLGDGKKSVMPAPGSELAVIDVPADQEAPGGPGSDWKSDVSPLPTQQGQVDTPTFTPDSPAAAADPAAVVPDPAGGGSAADAPANPAKGNGSPKFLGNGL
jgi:hypothetical protein